MKRLIIASKPAPKQAGQDDQTKCPHCKGSGDSPFASLSRPEECPMCHGTGNVNRQRSVA